MSMDSAFRTGERDMEAGMSGGSAQSLTKQVRGYWEEEPCGTGIEIVGEIRAYTREWFARVEEHRYRAEPFIHSAAQFTRQHGKRVLEIGVGAGTDHLQWARAGARAFGVDLTRSALETTCLHFDLHGLRADVQQANAEKLPFADATFDIVYSWGVIHHAERPDVILGEVLRVLRPGGRFVGMLYGRRSLHTLKVWVRHALLRGRPWRTFSDVVWHHVESIGTKAYTIPELRRLFSDFGLFSARRVITPYDTSRWPRWVSRWFPDEWGWFVIVEAAA
jgi:SAM-dependent methyltransferase